METNYVHKHIAAILRPAPGYAEKLPGGIHRGVAPRKVGNNRHLVVAYAGGLDVPAFSGGFVGSGMEYLLKVMDASESETAAQDAAKWVEDLLMASSGSNVSGAFVYFEKLRPFNLPVVEDDVIWQQVGRMFSTFVDYV
jgi:hypothetical protein